MCEYCGPEEDREAQKWLDRQTADRLERLARHYRDMADGMVAVHPTRDRDLRHWENVKLSAAIAIRDLAQLI